MQAEQLTSIYISYRSYLFAIAYNMLGEVQEAEDVVQDVFERLLQGPERGMEHPKAYLGRMVVNRSIDRLEHKKREREVYPGPWLPTPVMTESREDQPGDILSYAVLCLLESLNPVERAVLILREAFDYDYSEISSLCDIREDHCRQLLHRAKEKVRRPLKVGQTDEARRQELLQKFITACFSGDAVELSELLHRDIMLHADGGGKASAATKPLHGAMNVARFLAGFGAKAEAAAVHYQFVWVNGQAVVVLVQGEQVISIMIPVIEDGIITELQVMRNPDKIFFSSAVTN
jgi:RNA polymerase sigma-70 factor (ECF subfamily)